jgi:replicative DNA helicase
MTGTASRPGVRVPRTTRASASASSGRVDRLPPHAPEAERGVLGCILLASVDSLDECSRILRPGAEAFYDLRNQAIFAVMAGLHDARIPVDLISVQQRLREGGQLDAVGGLAYLNELADCVHSAANLPYYAGILLEKWQVRRLISTCTGIVGRAHEGIGDVASLIDQAEREVLAVRDSCDANGECLLDGRGLATLGIEQLEKAYTAPGGLTGWPSGYHELDKLTLGFRGGEFIVLAGRPGTGKTALVLNIARHLALHAATPVGIFSLEMKAAALSVRMMAAEAGVDARNVPAWSEADFARNTDAASRIAGAPIFVDDTGGLTIREIRARARRMVQRQGVRVLVLDYLQLIGAAARRLDGNRQNEVAEVSAGLKALAKELDVPILCGCQINRDSERENRRPRLSDLRESGSIEQDADVVGLMFRPTENPSRIAEENQTGIYPVNLIIAKQRDGAVGQVNFTFFARHQRFEQAAKIDRQDVPKP